MGDDDVTFILALFENNFNVFPPKARIVQFSKDMDDSCFGAYVLLYWIESGIGYPYAQVMAKTDEEQRKHGNS